MRISSVLTGAGLAAVAALGMSVVSQVPASASGDTISVSDGRTASGNTPGGGDTKCRGHKEFRPSTNNTVVWNSHRCPHSSGTYTINQNRFPPATKTRYVMSTGFEVWRFYTPAHTFSAMNGDNIGWARSRVNLRTWTLRNSSERVMLQVPYPGDHPGTTSDERLGSAIDGSNEVYFNGRAGYPWQHKVQRVQQEGTAHDYTTNVDISRDGVQRLVKEGVIKGLQTKTVADDPIAKALSDRYVSASAKEKLNQHLDKLFGKWKRKYGPKVAAQFTNTLYAGEERGRYRATPGALPGDNKRLGSSLDIYAPYSRNVARPPIYGMCYVALASLMNPVYGNGTNRPPTAFDVVNDSDYGAARLPDWQGERYSAEQGNGSYRKWRAIIADDTAAGPTFYTDKFGDSRTARPYKPGVRQVTPDAMPTRRASAEYAADKATCTHGFGIRGQGAAGSDDTQAPFNPGGEAVAPPVAVAQGMVNPAQIGAKVRYVKPSPAARYGTPMFSSPDTWATFIVTVPSTWRWCSSNSTAQCDFKFGTGAITPLGNSRFEVKMSMSGATGDVSESQTTIPMYFFKATPPGQYVSVKPDRVSTVFLLTGSATEEVTFTAPDDFWGSESGDADELPSITIPIPGGLNSQYSNPIVRSLDAPAKQFPVVIATPNPGD